MFAVNEAFRKRAVEIWPDLAAMRDENHPLPAGFFILADVLAAFVG